MVVSDRLLRFIQSFEGFSARWYKIGSDRWTIGWGFTDEWPRSKATITRREADALLRRLLATRYANPVLDAERRVGWQLPAESREALVSFTYNLGGGWVGATGNQTGASLWAAFRAKNPQQVAAALLLYINAGSIFEAGLRRRRKAERAMWLAGFAQSPAELRKLRLRVELARIRQRVAGRWSETRWRYLRRRAEAIKKALRR